VKSQSSKALAKLRVALSPPAPTTEEAPCPT
jgi:hypothetical protein